MLLSKDNNRNDVITPADLWSFNLELAAKNKVEGYFQDPTRSRLEFILKRVEKLFACSRKSSLQEKCTWGWNVNERLQCIIFDWYQNSSLPTFLKVQIAVCASASSQAIDCWNASTVRTGISQELMRTWK